MSNVLLSGIVGSTAYGLAGPDSDVDRLGIYAAPMFTILGLRTPEQSIVQTGPDITLHEVGKFCHLALNCNPTVMELLWLPDELYEKRTVFGEELIRRRYAFLSAQRVRAAYLGYATQQFTRLSKRGDGSFSADLRKRTAKHARHLARLLHQGSYLWHTGHLEIRLEHPQMFIDFGEQVAAGDLTVATKLIGQTEDFFDGSPTVLPKEPDRRGIDDWVAGMRFRSYMKGERP